MCIPFCGCTLGSSTSAASRRTRCSPTASRRLGIRGRSSCGSMTSARIRRPPPVTAERVAAGLAGYTSSPSPRLTGITFDGVSYTGSSCAARRRLRRWLGIGRLRIMLIMRSLWAPRTNAFPPRARHQPFGVITGHSPRGWLGACGESRLLGRWGRESFLTRSWVMPVIRSEVDAEPAQAAGPVSRRLPATSLARRRRNATGRFVLSAVEHFLDDARVLPVGDLDLDPDHGVHRHLPQSRPVPAGPRPCGSCSCCSSRLSACWST